jgi:uncharacterized protein
MTAPAAPPPIDETAAFLRAPSRRDVLTGAGALILSAASQAGAQTPPASTPAPAGGLSRTQSLFRIATGTTGGTYYPIGTIIANAVSNPPGTRPCDKGGSCGVPGLIAVAQATSGSVENLGLLLSGAAEAAMTQSDVAWQAYKGRGVFAGKPPFESLRSLGALYVETIHIVAGADIKSVADLRGLRVSLGEEGSGTLGDARLALAAHGLKDADLKPAYLKPATAADRMAKGELDAFFMVGGHPIQAVAELATKMPITLLPIAEQARRKLLAEHAFLVEAEIPTGVYENVGAVPTVGVSAELATRAERDVDLIYHIVRALWHERTKTLLTEGHPRGAGILVANAVSGIAAPLHPGAERFYREIGLVEIPPLP